MDGSVRNEAVRNPLLIMSKLVIENYARGPVAVGLWNPGESDPALRAGGFVLDQGDSITLTWTNATIDIWGASVLGALSPANSTSSGTISGSAASWTTTGSGSQTITPPNFTQYDRTNYVTVTVSESSRIILSRPQNTAVAPVTPVITVEAIPEPMEAFQLGFGVSGVFIFTIIAIKIARSCLVAHRPEV